MKDTLKKWVGSVSGFAGEVKVEMIKSTWPTRPELIESTIVVIVTVAMLSLFVGVSDAVIINLVRLILS
jgi:preprotein translocase subunit SecE